MRLGIMDKAVPVAFDSKQKMVVDPISGYLVGGNTKFTPELKAKFVELMRDLFPNVYAAAEMVGVSYTTVRQHMNLDKKLSEQMVDIKMRSVDHVESRIFEYANRPQNFMDRIAVMRAYRGELYNPKSTVVHEKPMSSQEAHMRRSGLAGAIDAEVISSSATILEGEIIEDSTVPGPGLAAPADAPSVGEAVASSTISGGGDMASGTRDPLYDLEG